MFVETNTDAKKIWKRFCDLEKIDNTHKRKNEFLKFKKDFYDYLISLPIKYFHEIPSDFVYYLNHDMIYNQKIEYYYQDIGFNRNTKLPQETSIVFL